MTKFEKFANKIFYNFPLIIGIGILGMDAIAVLAPILAHFGLNGPAQIIYTFYGFLCHQRPWRSIHIWDHQVAWCTRDTFIYLSMGLAALFVHKFKIRGVKWYLAALTIVPFALDGGIQFIAEINAIMNDKSAFFYASTNFFRMLTGSIFGAGAGLFLFSLLAETVEDEVAVRLLPQKANQNTADKSRESNKIRNFKFFAVIIMICFVSYLLFVQIWRITSPNYGPYGILDHRRYFPGVNYEEVERGGHGVEKP